MNVLIIGAEGFIGKNLYQRLKNFREYNLFKIIKSTPYNRFVNLIKNADVIFHLAGANREKNINNFKKKNYIFTKQICDVLKKKNKKTRLIFTSTSHVNKKTPYGVSKKKSEQELIKLSKKNVDLYIYRLTNIFGKWSKPFYNSVVATFCHQIANNKKIDILNNEKIKFVYIDDLINNFIKIIKKNNIKKVFQEVRPQKKISIKVLAKKILSFNEKLSKSEIPYIQNDFDKKLYSTYLSFINQNKAFFTVKRNKDHRGDFTELFKNNKIGQISFFSINKNKIRGKHYHDTKTEKFFLINGKVKFDFLNIISKKKYSMVLDEKNTKVVFTIPGWSHKIKNIGNDKAIFAVWTNEIFDRNKPDTYYYKF